MGLKITLEVLFQDIPDEVQEIVLRTIHSGRDNKGFRFGDMSLYGIPFEDIKFFPAEFNMSREDNFGMPMYHPPVSRMPNYEIRCLGLGELKPIESMPARSHAPKLPVGLEYTDEDRQVYIYHIEHGWMEFDSFMKVMEKKIQETQKALELELAISIVDSDYKEIDLNDFRDGCVSCQIDNRQRVEIGTQFDKTVLSRYRIPDWVPICGCPRCRSVLFYSLVDKKKWICSDSKCRYSWEDYERDKEAELLMIYNGIGSTWNGDISAITVLGSMS